MAFGDDPYLYWTGDSWQSAATFINMEHSCDEPITIVAYIMPRYIGQLQYSVDAGTTWIDIGFPYTRDEWAVGVEIDGLPPACDIRINVGVGTDCFFATSAVIAYDCGHDGALCECVYYQDFRDHVSELSLNHLLYYWVVDGVTPVEVAAVLDAPIPMETPDNFIEVGGRPFFTNLIDLLNSFGVPGFSFFPHENLRPLGAAEHGGYFRMRYPCDSSWIIAINRADNGDPAYRWSSEFGAEQWNQELEEWQQFSYDGWSAGPGEECQTLRTVAL